MEVRIRLLKWSAGLPVAMINEKTAEHFGVHPNDRISIRTNSKKSEELIAILDTIGKFVKDGEIAVSSEVNSSLSLTNGQRADIFLAPLSESISFIKKKLVGKELKEKEIKKIIEDIVGNLLSEAEIAMFVSAMYTQGMNLKEIIFLTKAISETGEEISFKNKIVVDKHCIGGIPGNRTTPLVVSICAATGLIFPKTSSRAITSAAGTSDVIETLAKVEFSSKQLKKIINKANSCLVWGGGLGTVPADEKIIKIERMLNIDPEAQLLASIMSKKIAVGSNHILIDIPFGEHAKINKEKALRLKKEFEGIARYFKRKIKVILTDGNHPIGKGIGPSLEMRDILKVLNQDKDKPLDLESKSLFLSGEILEMTQKAKKGKGIEMAREILESGRAFSKFKEIIEAQEGKIKKLPLARFKKNIFSKKAGIIKRIDNKNVKFLALSAGCPTDKLSGVYLHVKAGDKIKKRQKLMTLYSESRLRFNQAKKLLKKENIIILKQHN
jgi:putative thymidine phosphorylase